MTLAFEEFKVDDNNISGFVSITVTSNTSETWEIDLSVSNPEETQTLTFQATLTFSDSSDIETITGSGTFTSSIDGTVSFTLTNLQFDFETTQTALVCDDPIGGSITLIGTNSATLTFGDPPGCGFAFLSIDGRASELVSLDGDPLPSSIPPAPTGISLTAGDS